MMRDAIDLLCGKGRGVIMTARLAHHPGYVGEHEILAAPHPFAGLRFRHYCAILTDLP